MKFVAFGLVAIAVNQFMRLDLVGSLVIAALIWFIILDPFFDSKKKKQKPGSVGSPGGGSPGGKGGGPSATPPQTPPQTPPPRPQGPQGEVPPQRPIDNGQGRR